MKNYFLLKLLLFFVFCGNIMAQTDNNAPELNAKNAIYLNAGSLLVYNTASLNYDFFIHQSEKGFFKNYYLNLEAGIYNRNSGFAPGPSAEGILGGLGVIGLTGQNINHFEVALGVLVNSDTEIENEVPDDNDQKETFVLPEVAIGYRIQKKNGILFRVGIGFPKGVYLGLGYGF